MQSSERRVLPAAPADFGQPVPLPIAQRGDDARLFARRNRDALIIANKRLVNDGAFYRDVREKMGR